MAWSNIQQLQFGLLDRKSTPLYIEHHVEILPLTAFIIRRIDLHSLVILLHRSLAGTAEDLRGQLFRLFALMEMLIVRSIRRHL